MPVNPNDYALVVGINDYPSYRSLHGAIADASRFAGWLVDTHHGGGVPKPNCKIVYSTPNPIRPIQDDIDEKLEEIFGAISVPQHARRFYFYFSGHGFSQVQTDTHLCLPKWSTTWRNSALDARSYLDTVLKSGKFDEVIFLMDCCRVRTVSSEGLKCQLDFPMPLNAPGTRVLIANATEVFTQAFEAEVDGSDTSEVRGHFTQALMEALEGAAATIAGGVPASALKAYLELHVPRIAKAHNHNQTPEVNNGFLAGSTEPIFGSAPPIPPNAVVPVNIAFAPNRVANIALDGPDTEIRCAPAATGPWQLQLGVGLHVLKDMASNEELSFRVRPGSGGFDVHF